VPSTGTTGVVESQNKTLTEFSREIVAAIQSLHQQKRIESSEKINTRAIYGTPK